MTSVCIIDSNYESDSISIKDADIDNWYRVVDYPPNQIFRNAIGILIYQQDDDTESGVSPVLVTPTGYRFNNKQFRLRKLNKVTISVE